MSSAFLLLTVLAVASGFNMLGGLRQSADILEKEGEVCAYGDFNHDRLTDVLVRNETEIFVKFQADKDFVAKDASKLFPLSNPSFTLEKNWKEVACAIGDLNGDGFGDIVLSMRDNKDDPWTIRVYFRDEGKFAEGFTLTDSTVDQIAVFDVNGDGISDLLGVSKKDEGIVCILGRNGKVEQGESCADEFSDMAAPVKLRKNMPILFGSVTQNGVKKERSAEVIFPRQTADALEIEVWKRRDGGGWKRLVSPGAPKDKSFKWTLSPILADINRDSIMDLLVPICDDEKCTMVTQMYSTSFDESASKWNEWTMHKVDLNGFPLYEEKGTLARMRVGDHNLDGYPDLLVTVVKKEKLGFSTVLYAVPPKGTDAVSYADLASVCKADTKKDFCPEDDVPGEITMPGTTLGHTQTSLPFDFFEDGFLDILIQWHIPDDPPKWTVIVRGSAHQDVTFMKVQTFMPLPVNNDIKAGKGVPYAGACVTYEMETTGLGDKKRAVDCQLTATSHKGGLTPSFTLFGLGRNPNFVDLVTVTVPYNLSSEEKSRRHEQKQLVPNARLLVQPPNLASENNPTTWVLRLYLTPSALIFSSLAVMASVCSILLLVVLGLHFREKKFDRVERQAQSHRFHFDAM